MRRNDAAPSPYCMHMFRGISGAIGTVTIGVIVSCSSTTEPALLPAVLNISNVTFTGPPPPALAVATMPDSVRIVGGIVMNEPCYDFTAHATTRSDTLLVDLIATRRSGPCQQYIATFSYTLTVSSVDSTVVALRLVYDRQGTPTYRETVLEQAVSVP